MQLPAITPEQAFALATGFWRAGNVASAVAMCENILAAAPAHSNAWHLLGVIALEKGYYNEAIHFISKALPSSPTEALCHSDMGLAYLRLRKFQSAITCFHKAIAIQPNLADAYSNMAEAVAELGDMEMAIDYCQRAIQIDENHPTASSNLGALFERNGDLSKAIQILEKAVARRKDHAAAHWNLALVLLRAGKYQEGWREYEWRWKHPGFSSPRRDFTAPQWAGEPIPGKTLLIHWEQGLGDTLQFARYIRLAQGRSRAERVIFECQKSLATLLQVSNIGADIVFSDTLPSFDLYLPLLSLPMALEEFDPMPMQAPYLCAESSEVKLAGRLKVGLVWAGDPDHPNDRNRSISPDQLTPLLNIPGADFYSLQFGQPAREGITALTIGISDFADTAERMSELDLIISVDTAAAHLAGALGRPVWTLLPFVPDWRWGVEGETTSWYPTMRLFRQKQLGEWAEVIQRVSAELSALAAAR
jgi:tetratricopeptide (TPR) repeat protein